MPKFRIMRGGVHNDKAWAMGTTVEGANAREAVRVETKQAEEAAADTMGGFFHPIKPAPIVAVYELVRVPEEEWK